MLEGIIFFKDLLWGKIVLFCLFAVGLYITILLRGVQFRYLKKGFQQLISASQNKNKKYKSGDISSFQSLMTALAGAIGTGNIAGIATAIAIGGFGSLFWMWVMAAVGMVIAYSETILGIKYRQKNSEGEYSGGPMYTILHGLKMPKLAAVFTFLCAISAFGYVLVQANSVADALTDVFIPDNISVIYVRILIGICISLITALVTIGGVKSIGKVAGLLVPIMAILYLLTGMTVLLSFPQNILPAFKLIITSAFTGQSATGAFVGSTIIMALQNGVQYGVFANEAGLGSLSIAGASAQSDYPAQQGILSVTGVFISTMLVCTITGLSLAVTDVLGTNYGSSQIIGSPMVMAAFGKVHYYFRYTVIGGLILFAFTTILAWSYYGEKCIEFFLGLKFVMPYRLLFLFMIIVGAVLELELVWAFAIISNGLMAIPNLYSIIRLRKIVQQETEVLYRSN